MSKFGESATPRIDPRQLQDFLAVVEHGSITAAAANQFTGTSSVSQSIARLERRVGGRLFNRGRTGATLTARGRNLIDPAREALAALDRLVVEREFLLSAVPHLSVATTASLADDPAAVLLGALRTEVPNLRITISDPPGSSVADAIHPVMAGTADVAIMESLPTGVPGTRTVRLPDTSCGSSARPVPRHRWTGYSSARTSCASAWLSHHGSKLPMSIAICGRSNRESTTHS